MRDQYETKIRSNREQFDEMHKAYIDTYNAQKAQSEEIQCAREHISSLNSKIIELEEQSSALILKSC